MRGIASYCLLFVVMITSISHAGSDDFEDPDPNGTPVTLRTIDNVDITISTGNGVVLSLQTYFDDTSTAGIPALPETGSDKFYDAKTGAYNWEGHAKEAEFKLSQKPAEVETPADETATLAALTDWLKVQV